MSDVELHTSISLNIELIHFDVELSDDISYDIEFRSTTSFYTGCDVKLYITIPPNSGRNFDLPSHFSPR